MKQIIFAALGIGLLTVGCGGSDGSSSEAGAGSTNASAGGATAAAGDTSTSAAGASGIGGKNGSAGSSAAGSSAAGSSAAGSNAAGGASSGDCQLESAIVSCHIQTSESVAVCTETALEGTGAQVVREQCGGTVTEGEHCRTDASLAGYCKGGVTTYYYGSIWSGIGNSCEATSGTWCGK